MNRHFALIESPYFSSPFPLIVQNATHAHILYVVCVGCTYGTYIRYIPKHTRHGANLPQQQQQRARGSRNACHNRCQSNGLKNIAHSQESLAPKSCVFVLGLLRTQSLDRRTFNGEIAHQIREITYTYDATICQYGMWLRFEKSNKTTTIAHDVFQRNHGAGRQRRRLSTLSYVLSRKTNTRARKRQ